MTTDGGSTARAVSNEPVEATDDWKYMVGRFEVGYDAIKSENASKFRQAQIEKQLRYQAADKLRAFKRAIAIQFYGHNTGVIGLVSAVDDVNDQLALKDWYGETGVAVPERLRDYFTKDKDTIAVHDTSAADAFLLRSLVTGFDDAADEITLESGTDLSGVAAGDKVVLNNQVLTSGDPTDLDEALNGLLDITRNTSLHGISSADQPDWAAGVDETGFAASLDGVNLFKWFETIEQRSDHRPTFAYTTTEVLADAGGTELDQRRYSDKEDTMRLGFRKLNVMGVIAEGRPYVPSGFLFIGSDTALRKLSPDEEPSGVITSGDRSIAGAEFRQYEDRLGFYTDKAFRAQLTAVTRLGLGVVDGITEA